MNRFETDRVDGVVAVFENLTPSQKFDLAMAAPDLYFAVARLVRTRQINAKIDNRKASR